MADSDLLTIEEVAELLRVSRDTVYRLAAKGEIPGTKVGRIWRFSREAIEGWASRRLGEERGQRQLVERELAQSQERYHDLYENAPDMFATVELPGGRIVECNQTLAIQSGYRKEELLGRNVLELHAEADAERVTAWLRELAARGEGEETELLLRRKEGDALDVSLRASVMRDVSGRPIRGRLVWRDVRDRKRAERRVREARELLQRRFDERTKELLEANRRLRHEEARIRSLFQTVGVVILVLSRDGRILEWNAEAERVFGWKRGEVLGQLFVDRFVPIADRAGFHDALEGGLKGRPERGLETPVAGRAGDEFCLLWNLHPQPPDEKNRPSGVLVCGQDITELVAFRDALALSERRFREIADVVGAVFWVTEWIPASRAFVVRYVSPAFEGIWKRSCDSIYANPSEWLDGIVVEEREAVEHAFYRVLEGEPFNAWYHIKRDDGSVRRIHDRGKGIFDERGRLLRIVGIAEDVTDRPGERDVTRTEAGSIV